MRKLKQATQREKARRELKERKERDEARQSDRSTPGLAASSSRTGHVTPAKLAIPRRSRKITLH